MGVFGSDLDNTIIDYRGMFDRGASLLQIELPKGVSGKSEIKQLLNTDERWEEWVALQAKVYGELLFDADPFPGAVDTLRALRSTGTRIFIVSHRTRTAYGNVKSDLRQAASDWLERFCSKNDIELAGIYFEDSTDSKVDRIVSLGCDWFIDDLESVLKHDRFPTQTRGLHFSPAGVESELEQIRSWTEVKSLVS